MSRKQGIYEEEAFDNQKRMLLYVLTETIPRKMAINPSSLSLKKKIPIGDIDASVLLFGTKMGHFQFKSTEKPGSLPPGKLLEALIQLYKSFREISDAFNSHIFFVVCEGIPNQKYAKNMEYVNGDHSVETRAYWEQKIQEKMNLSKSKGPPNSEDLSLRKFSESTWFIFTPERDTVKRWLGDNLGKDLVEKLMGQMVLEKEIEDSAFFDDIRPVIEKIQSNCDKLGNDNRSSDPISKRIVSLQDMLAITGGTIKSQQVKDDEKKWTAVFFLKITNNGLVDLEHFRVRYSQCGKEEEDFVLIRLDFDEDDWIRDADEDNYKKLEADTSIQIPLIQLGELWDEPEEGKRNRLIIDIAGDMSNKMLSVHRPFVLKLSAFKAEPVLFNCVLKDLFKDDIAYHSWEEEIILNNLDIIYNHLRGPYDEDFSNEKKVEAFTHLIDNYWDEFIPSDWEKYKKHLDEEHVNLINKYVLNRSQRETGSGAPSLIQTFELNQKEPRESFADETLYTKPNELIPLSNSVHEENGSNKNSGSGNKQENSQPESNRRNSIQTGIIAPINRNISVINEILQTSSPDTWQWQDGEKEYFVYKDDVMLRVELFTSEKDDMLNTRVREKVSKQGVLSGSEEERNLIKKQYNRIFNWADDYPDPWFHFKTAQVFYGESPIVQYTAISCDGGRIEILAPHSASDHNPGELFKLKISPLEYNLSRILTCHGSNQGIWDFEARFPHQKIHIID